MMTNLYHKNMLRFTLPLAFLTSAFAQNYPPEFRQADIRGGGGDGKCTIEVIVDGSAEIEVSANGANLRTINGNRAQWRRFQCNRPMPNNPADFRFKGVDGRGRQSLLRQPGRGPAVIRIDDPDRGSEGYTFDIEWRDGGRVDSGSPYGGGNPQSRRAEIRRSGGDGKCTIEVNIAGGAEVEIRGDTAILRPLSGSQADWRRFVCNQPMPINPVDFRFTGIDGRGRQSLVRDPSRNGTAVIRIDDNGRSAEGYTFDLEWRGDSGSQGGGGFFGGGDNRGSGGFGGRRPQVEERRAEIRGGGGNGKCTIEVEVDGQAEVEIRGDIAYLRTLSGQHARFRRFQCNTPMPDSPRDFRFSGIDGRGKQKLLRSPNRGGPAVVRIEDRDRGVEGYTFDLEWR